MNRSFSLKTIIALMLTMAPQTTPLITQEYGIGYFRKFSSFVRIVVFNWKTGKTYFTYIT